MDHLSTLPIDLFINQITYLPFDSVINICKSNTTLHEYCTNSKYSNRWKELTNNTFRNIYNYQKKLKQIQEKLNINGYNYQIYVNLVKLLDPITQAMIYYKQNDMNSFNKLSKEQQFLALFLLNERKGIENYIPNNYLRGAYLGFIEIMDGKVFHPNRLNDLLREMAGNGNMKGVLLALEKGANIHTFNNVALREAVMNGHLEIVKFLVENGADIHVNNDQVFVIARNLRRVEILKYLKSL